MPTPTWTAVLPTTAGAYWFYGRRHPCDQVRLRIVEVHGCSTGCGYVSQSLSCDPDQLRGLWQPIPAPALPTIQQAALALAQATETTPSEETRR